MRPRRTCSARPAVFAPRKEISGLATSSRPSAVPRYRRTRKRTPHKSTRRTPASFADAQNIECTVDIHLMRWNRLVDRARHRGYRGFVKYHVDPFHRFAQRVVFADIDAMEIDSPADLVQVPLMTREQIIYDSHALRAVRQQTAHQRGSDESRPTRYQKSAH